MMLAFCLLIRHLLHGQEMALKLLLNIDYFFQGIHMYCEKLDVLYVTCSLVWC